MKNVSHLYRKITLFNPSDIRQIWVNDSVRFHHISDPWSLAKISLLDKNTEHRIVDNWLYLGDAIAEHLRLIGRPLPRNYVPRYLWVCLSGFDFCLKYKETAL